ASMSPFPAAIANAKSEFGAGSFFFAAVTPPCRTGKTSQFVMTTRVSNREATKRGEKSAELQWWGDRIWSGGNESGSKKAQSVYAADRIPGNAIRRQRKCKCATRLWARRCCGTRGCRRRWLPHSTIDDHLHFHTPILRTSRGRRVIGYSFGFSITHRCDEA